MKFPILGFLMESEMTGYDLKRRFQDPIGFFYRVSDGSLYPALKRLALDGLVTMHSERHGRRTRNIYAITPAGRARFLRTLREPAQPVFVYDESQVKIYFSHHDPQAALEHLDRAGREDAEVVKMLAWLAEEMKRRGDSPFRRTVVELGRAVCAAKVEVFAKLAAQLKREMAPRRRMRVRSAAALPSAASGR
ncbi:MAG TPA: PadR family transcriptional regulator [Candidatus Binataceae bacterium]|nr:PadR family transcriptional regulator [Candidatus Binataceae bacterium]